ncbi:virulence factor BrkB family protein [Utexia brackfieldae]|uniref:virulence factor BrkB family protein n=1 Tax=Utexia brackfieldae TaxID=3074108 RepID=UPI00370D0312
MNNLLIASDKIKRFLILLWQRMNENRLTTNAASLAYTTILALVPLIAVIFFLLSAFPMFSEVTETIKEFVFDNLVPATKETVQPYLEQFVANSNRMTVIGVCGLIVTSLLLINSIYSTLNSIWRTTRKRSFFYSLTIYWTILTLGPILVGTSLVISSYVFSLQFFSDIDAINLLLRMLPFVLSIISFWLLYSIVPTEPVPVLESVIGAIIAASLFELGKKAFTLYVTSFPTYQLIYGVLASLPLLLIWIYISWCIVLFGAEFAATLTAFRKNRQRNSDHQELTK